MLRLTFLRHPRGKFLTSVRKSFGAVKAVDAWYWLGFNGWMTGCHRSFKEQGGDGVGDGALRICIQENHSVVYVRMRV